jgi:hypothetical protein
MTVFILSWLKNWRFFTTFAAIGIAAALAAFLFLNKSEVEVKLISTASNRLQPSELPWEKKQNVDNEAQAKREITELSLWLKSYDYIQAFLVRNCDTPSPQAFCAEFMDNRELAPLRVMNAVDTHVEDARLLRVRVRAETRESVSALANALGFELVNQKQHQAEAQRAQLERELVAKKAELEAQLRTSSESLSKMTELDMGPTLSQNPDQHLAFLADLQTKASELDLTIAQNERAIERLSSQLKERSTSASEYGPSLQIQSIESENKQLREKRRAVISQLRKSFSGSYLTSGGVSSLTQIKEQFRATLENYNSIVKAIERVKLATSVEERPLEFFQRASPLLARDRWPLLLLLAMGVFLSQLFASAIFLILKMWQAESESRAAGNPEIESLRRRGPNRQLNPQALS